LLLAPVFANTFERFEPHFIFVYYYLEHHSAVMFDELSGHSVVRHINRFTAYGASELGHVDHTVYLMVLGLYMWAAIVWCELLHIICPVSAYVSTGKVYMDCTNVRAKA